MSSQVTAVPNRSFALASHRRSAVAWLAALALLLAQAVGLAHRIAHPGAQAQAAPRSLAHPLAASAFVLPHDDGAVECRLLDQLSHNAPLTPTALALAAQVPAAAPPTTFDTGVRATCARGYHARGPPHLLG